MSYRPPIPRELRKLIKELYNYECIDCTEKEDNHIHHKDGDPANNVIENLELVCWMCHYARHPGNDEIIEFHYKRYG